MKTFFLASLFFSILFFFQKTDSYESVLSLQKNWHFDKQTLQAQTSDKRNEKSEVLFLNGFLGEDFFYSFSQKKKYSFKKNDRIVYALNQPFFLKYQKVAKEVSFFSNNGEILWKRQMNSYPRIHPDGNLILFISGDHNQVIAFDENGNQISDKLQGIFLTDYFFAKSSSFVLFSNGVIYQIDRNSKKSSSHELDLNRKEINFCKSFQSSPKQNRFGIHLIKGEQDKILFFNQDFEEEFQIELEKVYPHKIHFAISDDDHILLNLPEKLVFFKKNEKLWTYHKKSQNLDSTYSLSHFTGKFFLASVEGELWFFDKQGRLLKKDIMKDEGFMRAISSFSKDSVFIETQKSIFHYQTINQL